MVVTKKISLSTKGECDIVDITPQVAEQLSQSGIDSGTVTIFVAGSTAGVTRLSLSQGWLATFRNSGSESPPRESPITTTAAGATVTVTPTSGHHYSVPRW